MQGSKCAMMSPTHLLNNYKLHTLAFSSDVRRTIWENWDVQCHGHSMDISYGRLHVTAWYRDIQQLMETQLQTSYIRLF